jgi:hypothetical protein
MHHGEIEKTKSPIGPQDDDPGENATTMRN